MKCTGPGHGRKPGSPKRLQQIERGWEICTEICTELFSIALKELQFPAGSLTRPVCEIVGSERLNGSACMRALLLFAFEPLPFLETCANVYMFMRRGLQQRERAPNTVMVHLFECACLWEGAFVCPVLYSEICVYVWFSCAKCTSERVRGWRWCVCMWQAGGWYVCMQRSQSSVCFCLTQ